VGTQLLLTPPPMGGLPLGHRRGQEFWVWPSSIAKSGPGPRCLDLSKADMAPSVPTPHCPSRRVLPIFRARCPWAHSGTQHD
jgi:hypothetical protein